MGCGDDSTMDGDASLDGGSDANRADSSTTDAGSVGVVRDGEYVYCAEDSHVGSVTVSLGATLTTVQGQVASGVDPNQVLTVEMSEDTAAGTCRLLRPPQLFCDPGCTGSMTCGAGGVCVERPSNQDVGDVEVAGLSVAVSMPARAPVYFYSFTGDLPHPGFTAETVAELSASGGDHGAFALSAAGVSVFETDLESVAIAPGTGAILRWTAGPSSDAVRVEIELNIANHGGTPGRIECVVDDSGEFTIPATLVDTLLAGEASGFPSLRMTRRSSGAVATSLGCVELRLESEAVIDVDVPGVTSCSDNEDCPDEQTCQGDLTCA